MYRYASGLDMLEKIAATGGLAATYEEDADGDGIPDFLQAEAGELAGQGGGGGGEVSVLQGAYAAAYAREKSKYKSMKKEAEGKTAKPMPKGIHRPRRGPDHDRNGIRLTLMELRVGLALFTSFFVIFCRQHPPVDDSQCGCNQSDTRE